MISLILIIIAGFMLLVFAAAVIQAIGIMAADILIACADLVTGAKARITALGLPVSRSQAFLLFLLAMTVATVLSVEVMR